MSESELIEKIVDVILKKLNDMFTNPSDNNDHLIGLYSRIKEIESLLSNESKDIFTLGIWGIGGIGKTTIAGAIFNKISSNFEGCCFILNVRGEEEKYGGLHHLRQRLLSTLLPDQIVKVDSPNIGHNFGSKRLSRKKVLIVLDDVTRFEQIELLVGDLKFAVGSRIIITTRDKHVLDIGGVDFYEMKKLLHDDALKLFSRHAFGQSNPDVGYEELSNRVIKYADGIPLALKVLGCFLVKRNKEEWESAINKLKKTPNMDILKVLKISYDGLDHEEKNIFLDIACFFEDWDRDLVIGFLNACGFFGQIGLSVLVDKSLISISNDNMIRMHDLLREMGREIVRQEAVNDPGRRSRLWHHEDIYKVLTCNQVTEAIEGISLDMSQVKELSLDPNVFTMMRKLRFLRFYGKTKFKIFVHTLIFSRIFNKSYFQGPTFAELRYFEWHGYPLNRLPLIIHPQYLVSFEMPDSKLKELWNGVQHLDNLQHLGLTRCEQLAKIPDLSLARNLEYLNLTDCTSLNEIHSSIQLLKELQYLYASDCSNLRRFPEITSCTNLKTLCLDGTAIEEVPSSIGSLSRLIRLNLSNCERLKSLPSSLCQLKSLDFFYLDGCSNLQRLSNEGENLEGMEIVDGSETIIREASSSIARFLGISRHHPLGFLSYDGLHNLGSLSLSYCGIKELPENIFGCHLSSLTVLYLDGNDFERIPESIVQLLMLKDLRLNNCERLKYVPELPNLEWLDISNCKSLKYLKELPCGLSTLNANNCTYLESMPGLPVLFKPENSSIELGDCLKLDQEELNKFAKDVLQKLQLQFTTRYDNQLDKGDICFPGNEIPEWISYQSTGSSITFRLPPGCFNNKILGVAFCIVFSFQHYYKRDLLNLYLKIGIKDGHEVSDFTSLIVGTSTYKSDHVLLGFVSKNYLEYNDLEYNDNNEVFFEFVRADSSDPLIKCGELIKKCGIHMFYAPDFGESTEHYRETRDLQDEEPYPKRLKY